MGNPAEETYCYPNTPKIRHPNRTCQQGNPGKSRQNGAASAAPFNLVTANKGETWRRSAPTSVGQPSPCFRCFAYPRSVTRSTRACEPSAKANREGPGTSSRHAVHHPLHPDGRLLIIVHVLGARGRSPSQPAYPPTCRLMASAILCVHFSSVARSRPSTSRRALGSVPE